VKGFASIVIGGLAGVAMAVPAAAQSAAMSRAAAEQRYQIGQMERVLEGAVEHGVTVTRDRLQALAQVPADMLVSDNAHARGFRLDGYGVFFDVLVPSFNATLTWTLRTLDQNDLGLDSALRTLQTHIKTAGDPNLEQALKRLELQMNPAVLARSSAPDTAGARTAAGSAASTAADKPEPPDDLILTDSNEAYRIEVIQALKDAMLAHSSSLSIGPNEWLTIAAKGNDDRPRLAPADSDARTRIIRLRGSDLADFLAGRISRDEALGRIEVRVF
jgi:sarcosine oxidase gamma subunit